MKRWPSSGCSRWNARPARGAAAELVCEPKCLAVVERIAERLAVSFEQRVAVCLTVRIALPVVQPESFRLAVCESISVLERVEVSQSVVVVVPFAVSERLGESE